MDTIYKGVWFLSKDKNYVNGFLSIEKEKCVTGTLTITENGNFTLETFGKLNAEENKDAGFTILGNTSDGKAITLFNCFEMNWSLNTNALLNNRTYLANFVAITQDQSDKGYLDERELTKIQKFRFSSYNFDSWMWNANFVFDPDDYNFKPSPGDIFSIKYKFPDKDGGVQLNNEIFMSFITIQHISGLEIAETKREIVEKNFIELTGEAIDLDSAIRTMYKILDLLTIGIGQIQSPQNVSFISNSVKFEYYFNSSKIGDKKKTYPPHMLFTRRNLTTNHNDIFKKWFDCYEIMPDVLGLYFLLCNRKNAFVNERFLFLVQFLESYHRLTNPISDGDKQKWYSSLDRAISKDISERDRQMYKEKLTFGYEPSLRNRLKQMLKDIPLLNILLKGEKINTFISKIVATRNYLTHYGDKTSEVIDDSKELHYTSEILDKIARYSILTVMGFSNDESNRLLVSFYHLEESFPT